MQSVVGQKYIPIDYLGIEHGLSNNAVTTIYQDRSGFMWFGTYEGLNRYDGYSFKVFRNQLNDAASLIHNRVVSIYEDAMDNLWIGTKKGISVYETRTARFSPVYFIPHGSTAREMVTVVINDIKTDNRGGILAGTAGSGLLRYEVSRAPGKQIPLEYNGNQQTGYHVQAIDKDKQNNVWLFVQGIGLCRYDEAAGIVRLVNGDVKTGICLEAANNNDRLWLGTENGLYEYDLVKNSYKGYHQWTGHLTNNKVVGLCLDKENNLWIATDGGGINILHTTTGVIDRLAPEQYKKSLTSNAVHAIYEDKESRKWIGTLRGGINIVDLQKNKFTTISHHPADENSLADNFVLSFCEDDDENIWIGTDGSGLSFWNRQLGKYTHYKNIPYNEASLRNNFVTHITKDFAGDIWVATYGGGVNRFNKKTGTFKRYWCYNTVHKFEDKNVWRLFEDAEKNLWAGTCNGGALYRYNRAADKFELFDEKLGDVIALTQDQAGNLWAGTFRSLFKLDLKNKQHEEYRPGKSVRAIYEDKRNNLWVGTEGGGLMLFDRTQKKFVEFTEANGLCNNTVLSILEDAKGNLWLSTFNGLSKFDPATNQFKNFYQSDGLQSTQFNYNAAMKTAKGELLFGGIKGFNIFYPDSVTAVNTMPELRLTALKINNVPIEQDTALANGKNLADINHLEIPYDKAMISVDFVALEYSSPDKINYAWYLEGWDKDWNYSGKLRAANYSRLNEGDYVLRIKSTNAAGAWNVKEKLIHITVLPPWYRAWWAYMMYGLVLAAGIRYYIIYKNRQARLKYEIQIAHLKAEKEKELNEKKLSFFTNVAHEFRTPLTLIINPVKEMLYSNDQPKDTGELNVVYRNARRLLSLVDQLLLFRKAGSEQGKLQVVKMNFADLCREVYLCFTQQARHKKINYEFICESDAIDIYGDREQMEITLFNLISNAMKFTPEGGSISLRLNETDRQVQLQVADTGCGVPEGTGEKLFQKFYQAPGNHVPMRSGFGIGLNVVRNFVDNHHGEISYTSKTGEGTTFLLKLQKGKEHFNDAVIFEHAGDTSAFLEELVEEARNGNDILPAGQAEEKMEVLVSDKASLLIVDDDVQIRNYVCQLFREKFNVHEAGSGEEGLQLAQQYLPDLVISDVVMQGMSGIELCNSIRENPSLGHIPVILLTSSSSADIKLKGIECGADDYITKPFDREILLARVANILRSRNNLQKYFYNEITLKKNNLKISAEYKEFLERCIAVVEKHMENEDFNIKMLASEVGMSHSNLYKRVKSISGQSVNGFIRFIRLRKAAEFFIDTNCNVNEAAFQVGIHDIKYFREQFHKLFGMNPSEYIKKFRKPFQKNFAVHKKAIRTNK